jgi:porphobilinogen synthase
MPFPIERPRRLRQSAAIRRMVAETTLDAGDLIYPLFVCSGVGVRREISSMPGVYHLSVDLVVEEVQQLQELGIPAVLLFGIPEYKDAQGSSGWQENGPVQNAIRAIKRVAPEIVVMTDVCLCDT